MESKLKQDKQGKYILEGILGIIFTLIGIVVVNVFWDEIGFITSDFEEVLPFMNASFGASIFTHLVLIFVRTGLAKSLVNVVDAAFALVVLYKLYDVFPFDFDGGLDFLNDYGKPLLILISVAVIIGLVASFLTSLGGGEKE